jgi:hypothetical protein
MGDVTRWLVLMSLTATPLTADDDRFELTPFWGATTLDSRATREPGGGGLEFDEGFEQGFQLGARFAVRFGERTTLEAEYRYSPNGQFVIGFDDGLFGGARFDVPIDVGSHAVTGGFLYDLASFERWRPFVGAMIGVEHFRTGKGETTLRTGVGGGVRFPLRRGVGVRVDVRYVLWPSFYLTDALEHAVEIDAGLTLGF